MTRYRVEASEEREFNGLIVLMEEEVVLCYVGSTFLYIMQIVFHTG